MKFVYTRKKYARSLLLVITVVAVALVGTAILTVAKTTTAISITVRNNSQREIRHIYLALGNPDNWGPDQLHGSTVQPGGSYVVSDVSCGSTVRVVAEDQNGCFVYYNASCDADQTWEITDATPPDCGG
jgi:hypothetical protein